MFIPWDVFDEMASCRVCRGLAGITQLRHMRQGIGRFEDPLGNQSCALGREARRCIISVLE